MKWNDTVIRYINTPNVAGSDIGVALQDMDLLINVQMAFKATDGTNSSGDLTVTLKDATNGTLIYAETFDDKTIATADLVANAWAYAEDIAKLVVKAPGLSYERQEGDWEGRRTVTVSGNNDIGYDISGSAFRSTHYLQKLEPQNTTLSFKLESAGSDADNTIVIALTENRTMARLPDAEEMKESKAMVLIIGQKMSKTILSLWDEGHKEQVLNIETFTDFDYEATHTLTFKNEYGNWYLVLDGKVLRNLQLNQYMEQVLTAEEGVYYRFTGWQDYTFKKVQFLNTPAATSATSNWEAVGYEMSGEGDNLSFEGKGYASWKNPIDLTKTTIKLQFEPGNNGWVQIAIADIPTIGTDSLDGLILPESEHNAISILFSREKETDLCLRLYGLSDNDKASGRLIAQVKNFNFDVPHDVRFVEKNGNYYIALDGKIIEKPMADGDNKYITTAITDCLKNISKNAYLRFSDEQKYGTKITNISFVEETFAEQ